MTSFSPVLFRYARINVVLSASTSGGPRDSN